MSQHSHKPSRNLFASPADLEAEAAAAEELESIQRLRKPTEERRTEAALHQTEEYIPVHTLHITPEELETDEPAGVDNTSNNDTDNNDNTTQADHTNQSSSPIQQSQSPPSAAINNNTTTVQVPVDDIVLLDESDASQRSASVGSAAANNNNTATNTNNNTTSPDPQLSPTSTDSSSSKPRKSSAEAPLTLPGVSADSFNSRLLHFHHSLNQDTIPRSVIEQFVFEYGVPDSAGMRSLLWKLLLGYLPLQHSMWESSLKQSRDTYEQFVQELTINPYAKLYESDQDSKNNSNESAGLKPLTKQKVSAADDPLNPSSNTEWSQYYRDQQIRDEIDKDVKRTYSSFHFFNERVRVQETTTEEIKAKDRAIRAAAELAANSHKQNLFASPNSQNKSNNANTINRSTDNSGWSVNSVNYSNIYISPQPRRKSDETHHDVIKRILFIYAKLNPGIKYVQGMNEILAPIYYVFAHDTSRLFADFAEADAFFCFTQIMSEIRDRFIKSLDSGPTGILAVVAQLNSLLKQCDHQLWAHLEQCGVDPRFYSFRWLTLLLSQEFELPEVLRLWDSLFADDRRFEFLLYVCASMIITVREQILEGDFADALRLLQHYSEAGQDFQRVLSRAVKLRRDADQQRSNGNKITVNTSNLNNQTQAAASPNSNNNTTTTSTSTPANRAASPHNPTPQSHSHSHSISSPPAPVSTPGLLDSMKSFFREINNKK